MLSSHGQRHEHDATDENSNDLRDEAHERLREVARTLRQPIGPHQHRELLLLGQWEEPATRQDFVKT
jgi:hypothetical protein